MEANIKFKGVEIDFAGKKYILPPLGVGAYRNHDAAEKIQRIQDVADELQNGANFGSINGEVLGNVIELTHLALLRNYPDITQDEIEDGISDIITALFLIQYLISQDVQVQKQMMEYAGKNVLPPTVKKK